MTVRECRESRPSRARELKLRGIKSILKERDVAPLAGA